MRRKFKIKDSIRTDERVPEQVRSLHGHVYPEMQYPASNEVALDAGGRILYLPKDVVEEVEDS